MFKILSSEKIAQIFTRFTIITNDLNTLGKSYTSTELVNKILRSSPKVYQTKWWQFGGKRPFKAFS